MCIENRNKINHPLSHKPNFIYLEPWCLYAPIQYIQYIHLAMKNCTEICYSSAYICGMKMYTEETHTCHFTTVKWYTEGNQWLMDAYTRTHMHAHTDANIPTHTNTVSCMHNFVYTQVCALRHFWGRRRACSGFSKRNTWMWGKCLQIPNFYNTLPFATPPPRVLSMPRGHHPLFPVAEQHSSAA